MNVVGKVGSLITQGVYSVATPFHPFGGAVDIIVVKQQDGTFRSTPWYVRFGKFQGALKGAEKIVRISVNGVEANFHMFLDNSGEAYFLREFVPDKEDAESNDQVSNDFGSFRTSQGDVLDNIDDEYHNIYDGNKEEGNEDRKSNEIVDELSSLGSTSGYRTLNYENFDEVENVVRSSEESNSEMVLMSVDGHVITAPISGEEENTDDVHLSIPQFHLGPSMGSGEDFDANIDLWNGDLYRDPDSTAEKNTGTSRCQNAGKKDASGVCESEANIIGCNVEIERSVDDASKGMSKGYDMFKSCLDLTASIENADSEDVHPLAIDIEAEEESKCSQDATASRDIILEATEANINHDLNSDPPRCAGEQDVDIEIKDSLNNIINNLGMKDFQPSEYSCLSNSDLHYSSGSQSTNMVSKDSDKEAFDTENAIHDGSGVIPIHSVCNEMENDAQMGSSQELAISAIEVECDKPDIFSAQRISGFGFEVSLCGHLLRPGMGRSFAKEAFEAHQITEDEFKASGSEIIKNENLVVRYKEEYFMWDKVAHIIVGMALFGFNFFIEPTDSIPVEYVEKSNYREEIQETHGISPSTSSNRWRLWPIPFRRVKSLKHTNSNCSNDDLFFDSESCLESPCEEQKESGSNNLSPRKQLMRTNMPTSEQIASLNLKDGQNTITFIFITRVLGKQQVNAHVYLWKWNTKIVISDVDGTITRSDVLGQVMPLVGRDWTQSGVARLFSAIKENGYQLLFLSARAIVQAYLTKSFLFNLKQDGNTLPAGPVVISPDGLFPSLYREVIRKAPHEFKIACLQDIRALFPSDYNPFYAGFGNRDTDELCYTKIGIPKGKIFIINPKGEVALYNCSGTKTYTSLHTLVDDMFPPTSLAEQEDYNCWNYWKVPLPSID